MTAFNYPDPTCITDDHRMLREQTRKYVDEEVIPNGQAWEDAGTVPHDAFMRMGELGFLGLQHPVAYGGSDRGVIASVVFAEELARCTYGGVPEAVLIHSEMSTTHITHRGTAQQKSKYLPKLIAGEHICALAVTEPDAGSDVSGMTTRATREGDTYILNGVKTYATNALNGDIFIVAARTNFEVKASRGVSLFIVERGTPGLLIEPMVKKHGMLSSDIADLCFDNMCLSKENLLGEENKGFYGIMENFQNERLILGAMSTGMASKAIELTIAYVRSRKAFGGTLWDLPTTRQRLALFAAKVAAVRALVYATAELAAKGVDCVREVSMVKPLAGETLVEVVNGCLQLHGGAGYMSSSPIERMTRDARLMTIGGGATEVLLEEVAKRI